MKYAILDDSRPAAVPDAILQWAKWCLYEKNLFIQPIENTAAAIKLHGKKVGEALLNSGGAA